MKKTPFDPLLIFQSPEFQSFLEHQILKPILSKVFQHLYPYLIAISLVWGIMFLSTIIILVILVRARI